MAKKIVIEPTPNLQAKPNVTFKVEEQNAAVWNKGYDCIIEDAIKCPCKTKDNANLSTCKNCGGSGWVYINSTQDRVVSHSINSDTKFKEWSEETIGTVSMSFARRSQVSFMDRITIVDSNVYHSEVVYPKGYQNNLYAYTIYNIESIVEIFRFITADQALKLLVLNTDYTFERNKVLFTNTPVADIAALKALTVHTDEQISMVDNTTIYEYSSSSTATPDGDDVVIPNNITHPAPGRWLKIDNFVVSLRYNHKLQYHVIDIPHIIRNSYRKNSLGRDELMNMPVNSIARLSHYVIDAPNFDATNYFDNSYH